MPEQQVNIEEMAETIKDLAAKVVSGESTLQAEFGLKPDEMEAMYVVAYNYYKNKKFDTAAKNFAMLMLFDPMEYKYCLGVASSLYMMGEYDNAVMCYFFCTGLDQNQPAPFLHMAECFLQMGIKEDAVEPLEKAIQLCGDNPEYSAMKNRASVMLKSLTVE
jgi:type III secretion system low calcium response chaperone LcrH/SycD